jgi:hypothetical protein
MSDPDIKLITFKYKDGTIISQQWDEVYDGPWIYGDIKEKIFYKDFNFYNDNINQIDSN